MLREKKRKECVYDGVKCLYYNMHHLTTGTRINNITCMVWVAYERTYGPKHTLARLQYGQYAEMD